MQAVGTPGEGETPLPPLRQELTILTAQPDHFGRARWMIYDPVRHRYFSIGETVFTVVNNWSLGIKEKLVGRLLEMDASFNEDRLERIIAFLANSELLQINPGANKLDERWKGSRSSLFSLVTHGYLFFRIPLVRPQQFLDWTYPAISFVFTRWFAALVIVLSLLGIYLAGRQWEVFVSTALGFFTLQGLAFYGLALIGVKVLHELGHAYAAVRNGCRVPTMGVAFMVLMPLLYTDVTDAWKLRERGKRLQVDFAGIVVELALAGTATLLWAFLPDGPSRTACFFVAAVSWVMSLLVNLNPFMKFDGYHILADSLGIENLQSRSSALARWWLRLKFFGIEPESAEPFQPRLRRTLIAYAFAMWIYRFFLFLGIALLVYHLAFKALGIILFVVEIVFFILLPVLRELRVWWDNKKEIAAMPRGRTTLSIAFVLVVACFIPFSTRLRLPAVVESISLQNVFTPQPAQIAKLFVRNGDSVSKGDLLVELTSRPLAFDLAKAEAKLELTRSLLDRQAFDGEARARRLVLTRELHTNTEEVNGLAKHMDRLIIRAMFDGVVDDIPNGLNVGDYVGPTTMMARVTRTDQLEVVAYLGEEQVDRFLSNNAQFVPLNPLIDKVEVTFRDRETTGISTLFHEELADIHGGTIAVDRGTKAAGTAGKLVPRSGQYRVRYQPSSTASSGLRPGTGTVIADARAKSVAQRIYERVAFVLRRESGF